MLEQELLLALDSVARREPALLKGSLTLQLGQLLLLLTSELASEGGSVRTKPSKRSATKHHPCDPHPSARRSDRHGPCPRSAATRANNCM